MAGVGGALKSFWNLVNNWENNQNAELKLNCEDGHLLVNYSCDLGVWGPPTPQSSSNSASMGHQGPRKGAGPSRQRRMEKRAAEKAANTGTIETITEQVVAELVVEQTEENYVIESGEKASDDSIEKMNVPSATKPADLKIAEEVSAVNLLSEKSSAEEVETKKDVTVKNASFRFKCDECSYKNISEKGLRQHRKKKHKCMQADWANEHIEQLDGNTSLPLDSPTNRSAQVKETTEDEMDLAHFPTADDPDDIFQNWIDSLTCQKISNMSQKELKHMNAELARKVALQDASGKKT